MKDLDTEMEWLVAHGDLCDSITPRGIRCQLPLEHKNSHQSVVYWTGFKPYPERISREF